MENDFSPRTIDHVGKRGQSGNCNHPPFSGPQLDAEAGSSRSEQDEDV
jgi:hypothetical protein